MKETSDYTLPTIDTIIVLLPRTLTAHGGTRLQGQWEPLKTPGAYLSARPASHIAAWRSSPSATGAEHGKINTSLS